MASAGSTNFFGPFSGAAQDRPVFSAGNIHYEVAGRTREISCGGVGAIHLLVEHVGLAKADAFQIAFAGRIQQRFVGIRQRNALLHDMDEEEQAAPKQDRDDE